MTKTRMLDWRCLHVFTGQLSLRALRPYSLPLQLPGRRPGGGRPASYKKLANSSYLVFLSRSFTKPLVSRENMVYKAVEREAPPPHLHSTIPRGYAGNLPSVKSSEHSPISSDDRRPRSVFHKAHAVTSIEPMSANDLLTSRGPNIDSRVGTEPGRSPLSPIGYQAQPSWRERKLRVMPVGGSAM
jgi:hypothetical protein